MSRRHVSIAAMIGLFVTMGMTGCTTSSPAPTSTPTGFATEAEAFAAAEATYRAYVDALNAVDLSDPATFEPVYELTAGELNATERESYSQLHADGNTISGKSVYFNAELLNLEDDVATLAVCLDVSDVDVLSATGTSIVPEARPDIQSIAVDVDLTVARILEVRPSGIAGRCS
jgi:hypothetical protein